MKRILTSFKREKGDGSERRYKESGRSDSSTSLPTAGGGAVDDSPEGRIVIATKAFCASGDPQSQSTTPAGDEVLHLPTIVDLAESSPTAARAAAHTIRKFLESPSSSSSSSYLTSSNSKKNGRRSAAPHHAQYNAIMLMRILSDNPGRTFTRNLGEAKFVAAVKELLKHGREPSVRQILVETLEYFDKKAGEAAAGGGDGVGEEEGLKGLLEVWAKEKKTMAKLSKSPPPHSSASGGGGLFTSNGQYQSYPQPQPSSSYHLPDMQELAARISESQTSAKLLEQVLQSTPQAEVPHNELIREFADRCKVASRSIQSYISTATTATTAGADGNGMDEDTLAALVVTNDLLTMALGKHARAVKEALEKKEVHKTESARITDVLGDGVGFGPGGGGVGEDRPATPPRERGGRMEVDVAGAQRGPERERERAPDSPVSPATPGPPVAYRY
ncbi:hypothetical protein L873DRAFT_25740 [Choiromyces venosus 120613-1]|uniref:GAT domain-containing protein n=1 Tax=Choiromyces venosus 120613-1 TaxID=1336337 RepID=A0A3N4K6X0_9PEZI|nr:hypothetical protein L873DRAFT_25740 [Choiromyces venosus 120613-1]